MVVVPSQSSADKEASTLHTTLDTLSATEQAETVSITDIGGSIGPVEAAASYEARYEVNHGSKYQVGSQESVSPAQV